MCYRNVGEIARKMRTSLGMKKRKYMLRINGARTLNEIQSIMNKTGYKYFFDMGTLLGIVRNGKLLRHDLDIDVAIYVGSREDIDAIDSTLINNGCKKIYMFFAEGVGIIESSYQLNGVKFDTHYYYKAAENDLCYLFYQDPNKTYAENTGNVTKLICSPIEIVRDIEIGNMTIRIPDNAEKYLQERYGKNWRIPDKTYVYWKGHSATPCDLQGYREVFNRQRI